MENISSCWYKPLIWLLLLISICFISCKKDLSDQISNTEQLSVTDRFFTLPTNINQQVKKVAEEIKRRELIGHFVENFALSKGFPIWDKSLVTNGINFHKQEDSGSAADDYSLVYIPLVIDYTGKTNGFIRAIINDSISLSFSLAQDYKNYPHYGGEEVVTAIKYASFFMMFDHEIFGTTKFKMLDGEIFSPDEITHPIKDVVYKNATNGLTESQVCWRIPLAVALNGSCSCGAICNDWEICNQCGEDQCITFVYSGGGGGQTGPSWPIGGGIPTGGGPSTTGSGGGGYIPPYYPCVGGSPAPINPEPLPPCPPPDPNPGWQPDPMPTPCQKIENFKNRNDIKSIFSELRTEAINNTNHESAYRFTTTGPYPKTIGPDFGTNGVLKEVKIPITPMQGYMHTHPGHGTLPIFSPDDLLTAYILTTATDASNNQPFTDPKTFVLGVTTSAGNSYILTIQDVDAFKAFAEAYLDPETATNQFDRIYEAYIKSNATPDEAELGFLKLMNSKNTGLAILKADSTFTQYYELTLSNHNSVVTYISCN